MVVVARVGSLASLGMNVEGMCPGMVVVMRVGSSSSLASLGKNLGSESHRVV